MVHNRLSVSTYLILRASLGATQTTDIVLEMLLGLLEEEVANYQTIIPLLTSGLTREEVNAGNKPPHFYIKLFCCVFLN